MEWVTGSACMIIWGMGWPAWAGFSLPGGQGAGAEDQASWGDLGSPQTLCDGEVGWHPGHVELGSTVPGATFPPSQLSSLSPAPGPRPPSPRDSGPQLGVGGASTSYQGPSTCSAHSATQASAGSSDLKKGRGWAFPQHESRPQAVASTSLGSTVWELGVSAMQAPSPRQDRLTSWWPWGVTPLVGDWGLSPQPGCKATPCGAPAGVAGTPLPIIG